MEDKWPTKKGPGRSESATFQSGILKFAWPFVVGEYSWAVVSCVQKRGVMTLLEVQNHPPLLWLTPRCQCLLGWEAQKGRS